MYIHTQIIKDDLKSREVILAVVFGELVTVAHSGRPNIRSCIGRY